LPRLDRFAVRHGKPTDARFALADQLTHDNRIIVNGHRHRSLQVQWLTLLVDHRWSRLPLVTGPAPGAYARPLIPLDHADQHALILDHTGGEGTRFPRHVEWYRRRPRFLCGVKPSIKVARRFTRPAIKQMDRIRRKPERGKSYIRGQIVGRGTRDRPTSVGITGKNQFGGRYRNLRAGWPVGRRVIRVFIDASRITSRVPLRFLARLRRLRRGDRPRLLPGHQCHQSVTFGRRRQGNG